MRRPTTRLSVPASAATLEDIAQDFERRAAAVMGAHALGLPDEDAGTPARVVESRTWEEAARIIRKVKETR